MKCAAETRKDSHPTTPFLCPYGCKKEYNELSGLTQHIRLSTAEKHGEDHHILREEDGWDSEDFGQIAERTQLLRTAIQHERDLEVERYDGDYTPSFTLQAMPIL
jgi:hypothetical protein